MNHAGTDELKSLHPGLIPRAEQGAHNKLVRESLLLFLQQYPYAVTEAIQAFLNYKTERGTTGLLKRLVQHGYVKHHKMKNLAGRGLNLWGLTVKAIYAINDPASLPKRVRGFEPSRVSLATLPHTTETQRVHAALWNTYRKVWVPKLSEKAKRLRERIGKSTRLADLAYCEKNDEYAEIEVELTIKSRRRYKEILSIYMDYHESERYTVVWLTKTGDDARRLRSIFAEVSEFYGGEARISYGLHQINTIDEFIARLHDKGDDD